jgi:hypothetical protein
MPSWLEVDIGLIERALCVGFFHYAPHLWMIGEVEPLKGPPFCTPLIIERVLRVPGADSAS